MFSGPLTRSGLGGPLVIQKILVGFLGIGSKARRPWGGCLSVFTSRGLKIGRWTALRVNYHNTSRTTSRARECVDL